MRARYEVRAGERVFQVEIEDPGKGPAQVWVDGELLQVDLAADPARGVVLGLFEDEPPVSVPLEGGPQVRALPERGARRVRAGERVVRAPLTGSVVQLSVAEGQPVRAGEALLVIEAMKMENPIAAPCEGIVARLRVEPGATVRAGEALLEVEEEA